jgi:GAF domain-containing protein
MTNGGREAQVLEAVVSLVDSLLDDFDVVELLTQLTEQCARLLDVASAGLLLASPGGQLQLMAATSERTRDVEVFQLQSEQGPCLDCYASGREVSVADLRTEGDRWPQFVEVALDAGFASVHAVPMRAAGMVLGSLGLFGTKAGELNASDLTVGQTLAHVATVAVLQEGAPTQHAVLPRLRAALASRVVVEQAKGFLRGRLDVSVDEAFALLRRYALAHGEHLTQAARRLVSDPASRPEILALITEMSR